MKRITEKDLNGLVNRLNIITNSPLEPYTKTKEGKYVANIGNYHIYHAYGGVALHRMQSEGGGISDVLGCGYSTKRELYHMLYSYIRGIESVGAL